VLTEIPGLGQTTPCGTTPVPPTCPAGYAPALQGNCTYSCVQQSTATDVGSVLNWPSTLLATLVPSLSGGGFGALPIIAIADVIGWGAVLYLVLKIGGGK
jgi:hypothetical protein